MTFDLGAHIITALAIVLGLGFGAWAIMLAILRLGIFVSNADLSR